MILLILILPLFLMILLITIVFNDFANYVHGRVRPLAHARSYFFIHRYIVFNDFANYDSYIVFNDFANFTLITITVGHASVDWNGTYISSLSRPAMPLICKVA
jgi:hypothetical protein